MSSIAPHSITNLHPQPTLRADDQQPVRTSESTHSTNDQQGRQPVEEDPLFWDQYCKEADLFDKELVKGMDSDLNTLLIFAGLFSAIDTAFIIECYKDLMPDPAESGGTNDLLRTLIRTLDNSTTTATIIQAPDFSPSPRMRPVNALLFASLCCSLFAAFGAVMAKQWLNEYERAGAHRSPYARAVRRHAKYLGMEKYGCEMVMQSLGTVLQLALFLFLVALSNWLWGIDRAIAAIAITSVVATFMFYIITTSISVVDSASPFSTRLSAALRSALRRWSAPRQQVLPHTIPKQSALDQSALAGIHGQCVAWLRDNATTFQSVAGMAHAASLLPEAIGEKMGLEPSRVGPILLQAILSSNAIPLRFANGTVFEIINILRDVMSDWENVPITTTCHVVAQLNQALLLTMEKDPALSESVALVLASVNVDIPDHLETLSRPLSLEVLKEFIQIPSLTLEGRRAGVTLLGRTYLAAWESEMDTDTARVLVETACEPFDDDPERFGIRLRCAFRLGPTRAERRYQVWDRPSMQVWHTTFGTREFREYALKWESIVKERSELDFQIRPIVALDFLTGNGIMHGNDYRKFRREDDDDEFPHDSEDANYWSSYNWDHGGLLEDCDPSFLVRVLGAAFEGAIKHHEKNGVVEVDAAPLFWWNRLRLQPTHEISDDIREHLSRLATPKYLPVIRNFLIYRLWETAHIPDARSLADAIQAYVAEVKLQGPTEPIKWYGGAELGRLVKSVRTGSYRFQGPADIGQELWECLRLLQTCGIGEMRGNVANGTEGIAEDADFDWSEELTIQADEGNTGFLGR